MIELIGFPPSPFVRKVRIALLEKGLPFVLKDEAPWESSTQTGLYNPLQKVPIIKLTDDSGDKVIYESRFILEYLELKYPDTKPLVSHGDVDARLLARQIEALADGVGSAMQLRFFELLRGEAQSDVWLARQERKIEGGMKAMQDWVLDTGRPSTSTADGDETAVEKSFLVSDEFGVADIAVGAICGFFDQRLPEYDLRGKYPALWRYCQRLEQRPSFKQSVPADGIMQDKVV